MKTTIFRYVVIVLAVLLLGALGGFYFFLRSRQSSETSVDAARGLGVVTPSFQGGIGSTYQNIVSAITGNTQKPSSGNTSVRLWEVSATPVAGFGWSNTTTLTFVERATGYVLSADPASHAVARKSSALMPKTYEAFVGGGDFIIARGVDEGGNITTYSGSLLPATSTAATSSSGTLRGTSLPLNISHLSVNPSARTIFYSLRDVQGVSLFTANWDGTGAKRVFSSPLDGWRLFSLQSGLVMSQNASDNVLGYAYTLNKTGALQPLFSLPGLLVLPHPSAQAYLYSDSGNAGITLYAKTAASTSATRLSVHTLAEKCVWLKSVALVAYCAVPVSISSQHFLDDWYRGLLHTTDELWQINVQSGQAQLVYSPQKDDGVSLDMGNLSVDPSGNYIAFKNTSDQSLWMWRINK